MLPHPIHPPLGLPLHFVVESAFYKVLVYFLAKILTAFSNNKDAIQS